VNAYVKNISSLGTGQIGLNWTMQPIKIWENWQQTITFNDFDSASKRKIIDQINEKEDVDNFGAKQPKIQVDGDLYEFKKDKNDEKWKYVEVS
jgi:hypothetical protein